MGNTRPSQRCDKMITQGEGMRHAGTEVEAGVGRGRDHHLVGALVLVDRVRAAHVVQPPFMRVREDLVGIADVLREHTCQILRRGNGAADERRETWWKENGVKVGC